MAFTRELFVDYFMEDGTGGKDKVVFNKGFIRLGKKMYKVVDIKDAIKTNQILEDLK